MADTDSQLVIAGSTFFTCGILTGIDQCDESDKPTTAYAVACCQYGHSLSPGTRYLKVQLVYEKCQLAHREFGFCRRDEVASETKIMRRASTDATASSPPAPIPSTSVGAHSYSQNSFQSRVSVGWSAETLPKPDTKIRLHRPVYTDCVPGLRAVDSDLHAVCFGSRTLGLVRSSDQ